MTSPPRSAIPKVIGILMIIFGSLGVMTELGDVLHKPIGRPLDIVMQVTLWLAFASAALEIAAGIALVTYRAKGIPLSVMFAIASLAATTTSIITSLVVIGPRLMIAMFGVGPLVRDAIYLAWPIVVLALVTRPAARGACSR